MPSSRCYRIFINILFDFYVGPTAESRIMGKGGKALRELINGLARWNAMTRGSLIEVNDDSVIDDGVASLQHGTPEHTHIELAQIVLAESGYMSIGYATHWQHEKSPETPGRLENLKELVNPLGKFEVTTLATPASINLF